MLFHPAIMDAEQLTMRQPWEYVTAAGLDRVRTRTIAMRVQ
jgi:hypothetical protein